MSLPLFLVRELFKTLGYEVRRVPKVAAVISDEREVIDPVTAQYLQAPAGYEVPLAETRGLFALGLPLREDIHPFVRASVIAKERVEPASEIRSVLARYYEAVTPRTALEVVDLAEEEAPGLADVPPEGWTFPWSDRSVEQTMMARRRSMRLDALQYGKRMPPGQGFTAFGPAGEAKLDLEVLRIERLVRSYATEGFRPFDRKNPLRVTALRRDNDYRWLVADGHHRFAACAAFSIKTVPAIVRSLVRREDHEFWPQVVSGVFRPEGALKLFDRLFRGEPARICRDWDGTSDSSPTQAMAPGRSCLVGTAAQWWQHAGE